MDSKVYSSKSGNISSKSFGRVAGKPEVSNLNRLNSIRSSRRNDGVLGKLKGSINSMGSAMRNNFQRAKSIFATKKSTSTDPALDVDHKMDNALNNALIDVVKNIFSGVNKNEIESTKVLFKNLIYGKIDADAIKPIIINNGAWRVWGAGIEGFSKMKPTSNTTESQSAALAFKENATENQQSLFYLFSMDGLKKFLDDNKQNDKEEVLEKVMSDIDNFSNFRNEFIEKVPLNGKEKNKIECTVTDFINRPNIKVLLESKQENKEEVVSKIEVPIAGSENNKETETETETETDIDMKLLKAIREDYLLFQNYRIYK